MGSLVYAQHNSIHNFLLKLILGANTVEQSMENSIRPIHDISLRIPVAMVNIIKTVCVRGRRQLKVTRVSALNIMRE